ncbi:AbrB/MazE/SpoVT family DNA-binding domain-containing protein [Pelodictyon luteolum]|uniref:Transcriptional regulator, AbrB family n=1 Tax=Chlorobium luteolum (strain DSM 273 / BCRC 81028 / 2530) TaxID=319225 RepID=Q3B3Q3_CHLL3|nr:AbrB/MazE/SpoVT family DNA-binding domain-containing protein [Pelodictyon luteolum]ABB24028.1 transcriptional regulator, AbrB family [Pelodictyon luteolum DSM 273]
MEIRKISEEGRISIPVAIRNKAGLNTGDTVAVRIEGEHIIISKPEPKEDPYLAIAEASLTEWLEAEDEKAWEGLSGPEDNERRKETSGARPQGERRRPEAEP